MLQLQHLPVLLLCAHAALLENFTLEIAAIFQNVRRRLAVNKLSSPNNFSSYVRKLSMPLVQNISQRVPQFHKMSAKGLNATNTSCYPQQ